MTLRERVIVETYTGFCMTKGDEREAVYKYMDEIMGRPVFTHELANEPVIKELQEKSKVDFMALGKCGTDFEKVLKEKLSPETFAFIAADEQVFGRWIERLKNAAEQCGELAVRMERMV